MTQNPSLRGTVVPSDFVLKADDVKRRCEEKGCELHELLLSLSLHTKHLARAPVSNFLVCAAAVGLSGNVYLGVNMEFPGSGLETSCHGEEFAMTLAHQHGELGIESLVVNAFPCGFCRQMMSELSTASTIEILVLENQGASSSPQQSTEGENNNHHHSHEQNQVHVSLSQSEETLSKFHLRDLLPRRFGPSDLGVSETFMGGKKPYNLAFDDSVSFENESDESLARAALRAATFSHCPYSKSAVGCALRMRDGTVHVGTYIENSAYNPSIPPWKGALIAAVEKGYEFDQIAAAALVSTSGPINHEFGLRGILEHFAPSARVLKLAAKYLAEENGEEENESKKRKAADSSA